MEKKKQENNKSSEQKTGITELTDSLQRLQADFENYRKWVECKKADDFKKGKIDLIKKLLPIIDQIELALKNQENTKFREGVELIFKEFKATLDNEGLQPIECVGNKFDPFLHEVMVQEKSDKEEDIVLEEIQKGYKVGDIIIRHSKVKVSKK